MTDQSAGRSALDGGPAVRRLADWDAEALLALREQYGSPLYVLDLDRVRENYRRLDAAFPDADVHYAAKANALGRLLDVLHDAGAGVECASAGEVVRALDAGVPGDRVHYTAVNPPAPDLDTVVELWTDGVAADLTVTAGAEDTVARLANRGYDGRFCVRVNPGVGAGHHEKVRTGADAKFGVPIERALDVARTARAAGMDVVGVHAHAGSGIQDAEDLDAHREMVARVGDVARDLDAEFDLEFVDVGGGFGVPYRETDGALDLDAVSDATRDALGDVDAELVVEPGRYLVADAGVLLADVNTVKQTAETTVVGVDAGMTTLARPAIYGAYHALRNVSADGEDSGTDEPSSAAEADTATRVGDGRGEVRATVTGPICESADVFAEDRPLPEPRRGDVLALGNAGAYGYEMASNYNSRPRPASVVLADDDATLARRREPLSDLTTLEL
ncbi:diaminopimelate decarboxylase [Halorubellus sp. JP-L1]|uniref:diaminopimelate decarboxylase n=1 Tax=Halorubellus sp. JP-L1 TaxID=2715753 RepID=UPI00140DD3F3|nr:diaminopimelate decarboxylase [Halorubellus sp. JP-L1]NHN42631.1 diaminopimelate decarboxylase [Halorubellus sp. JP-L1]